jgi:hypothetical protein
MLASLDALRRRFGLTASSEDARLLAALSAASAQIERLAGRRFTPRQDIIHHDAIPLFPTELLLTEDLLVLTALEDAAGSIPLDDALLIPSAPASLIVLRGGRAFTWAETPLRAVAVTGLWGWHDQPATMWRLSGDTVRDNPLSAVSAILTVTDAAAPDSALEQPRFQVGQLLRVGDELMRVLAVNGIVGADDTLTVARGVNGSTAVQHAQGTPIEIYRPPADVESLAVRWAAALYKEPDSRAPQGVPAALLRDLEPLRRVGVRS